MNREQQNISVETRGSKFNQAVNQRMEKEYKETNDVRGAFVTHAFPIENLSGIVSEGGMRSGIY